MTVYTLTIDGASIPLDDVVAQITVRHGLDAAGDPPTASILNLAFLGELGPAFACGMAVAFDIDTRPRFRGVITDLSVSIDPDEGRVSLIAAGNLSRISLRKVGYGDWPQETWTARVQRVFSEASWTQYTLQSPPVEFQVASRLAAETTVTAQLADLAATGGATICDLPDGKILVQALGARQPAAGAPAPPALPPYLVRFAPDWTQTLDVVNVAVVGYGTLEDPHTRTTRNEGSVETYGERSSDLAATFATQTDADARGLEMVNRRGYPRWLVPTCDVLALLDPYPSIGKAVTLGSLPAGSPLGSTWTPVVEGWSDQLDAETWTTTLILSDPARSGLTLPWQLVTPGVRWQDTRTTATWNTAYSMEAIAA